MHGGTTTIHNVKITPSEGDQLVKVASSIAKHIVTGGLNGHIKITFWSDSPNISKLLLQLAKWVALMFILGLYK
jgi:hypothetical protein